MKNVLVDASVRAWNKAVCIADAKGLEQGKYGTGGLTACLTTSNLWQR